MRFIIFSSVGMAVGSKFMYLTSIGAKTTLSISAPIFEDYEADAHPSKHKTFTL